MNTKLVMAVSSIFMGLTGVILLFLPQELVSYLYPNSGPATNVVMLQILGALYFAFAMVNWTAKANLIGGIYARPIAIGNLSHFTIGALALVNAFSLSQHLIFQAAAVVYVAFAILFGIIFFRHPVASK